MSEAANATGRRGDVLEMWRCPEHEWTWEYHYSPGCDARPRCPAYEDADEPCGRLLDGPYEAVIASVPVPKRGEKK